MNKTSRVKKNIFLRLILSVFATALAFIPTYIGLYFLSFTKGDVWATIAASAVMLFFGGGFQVMLILLLIFVLCLIWKG